MGHFFFRLFLTFFQIPSRTWGINFDTIACVFELVDGQKKCLFFFNIFFEILMKNLTLRFTIQFSISKLENAPEPIPVTNPITKKTSTRKTKIVS